MTEIDEPVVIAPYSEKWPELYEREAARLHEGLGGAVVAIEHIGSTAVQGVAAKPIIDLMVGVSSLAIAESLVALLAAMGYEDCGGFEGRRYFRSRAGARFNVQVMEHGSQGWRANLLLRDYLRSHPAAAARYEDAKRAAAETAPMLLAYSNLKAGTIGELLAEAEAALPVEPTEFSDLNGVLERLVEGVQRILAEGLTGIYLQGSFALGDADAYSDVDFLVITRDELTQEEFAALDAMHKRLYALESPWAQHLEGSYMSESQVRQIEPAPTPVPYLDNGARDLSRDTHCNTAVVRWTLREHGVALLGPEPETLIDPVSADQLRAEVRAVMPEYVAWAPEGTKAGPMSRWKQPYLVLSMCRMLHTLRNGVIASKLEAGQWALETLDPAWRPLIQAALGDRPDPWGRVHQQATPEAIEATLAFVDYAMAEVSRVSR